MKDSINPNITNVNLLEAIRTQANEEGFTPDGFYCQILICRGLKIDESLACITKKVKYERSLTPEIARYKQDGGERFKDAKKEFIEKIKDFEEDTEPIKKKRTYPTHRKFSKKRSEAGRQNIINYNKKRKKKK